MKIIDDKQSDGNMETIENTKNLKIKIKFYLI